MAAFRQEFSAAGKAPIGKSGQIIDAGKADQGTEETIPAQGRKCLPDSLERPDPPIDSPPPVQGMQFIHERVPGYAVGFRHKLRTADIDKFQPAAMLFPPIRCHLRCTDRAAPVIENLQGEFGAVRRQLSRPLACQRTRESQATIKRLMTKTATLTTVTDTVNS